MLGYFQRQIKKKDADVEGIGGGLVEWSGPREIGCQDGNLCRVGGECKNMAPGPNSTSKTSS